MVAGQGTIDMELSEQCPGAHRYRRGGGGGLVAGIAAWYANLSAPGGRHGAQRQPDDVGALAAGRPVDVEVAASADSSAPAIRNLAHEYDQFLAIVTVPDEAIVDARRGACGATCIWSPSPGAAAALAAFLCGAYDPEPDERVVVVVCGANTDPASVA